MSRPWTPTAKETEEAGLYGDYAAFKRWFAETIDDDLPGSEPGIWDALTTTQQAFLYAALADAFDAAGGQP